MKDFTREYDILRREIIFKPVYFNLFNDEIQKTRIFTQQVDNKITDMARATNKRKISYIISLLKETAIE